MLRKQKQTDLIRLFRLLSRQDSNLKCLNQNQMCYHYTTGQSHRGNRKLIAFSIISIPFLRVQRYYVFLF